MLRAISSINPQSIFVAYIIVGAALIFVPMLYYWQECNIVEQYVGSPNYFCDSDVAEISGFWFKLINPFMFILYIPLASGMIVLVLRTFRHKMSALNARRGVIALTGLTFASSLFIILGALSVHFNNDYYAGKQCVVEEEWMKYCLLGTARTNLSGMFAPIEIGFGLLSIALAILYRNEY